MNPDDNKQNADDQNRQDPGPSAPGEDKAYAPGETPDSGVGDDRNPGGRRDQPDAEPQIPAEKPAGHPNRPNEA